MSLHDTDRSPSDSDDSSDLQRRSLTRSLVAFDTRQAQARYQARRQPTVTICGNVTFVDVYKPAQYNTGPASGTQGYLTTMCKLSVTALRWRRLWSHDSRCMQFLRVRKAYLGFVLTCMALSVQWRHGEAVARQWI